MSDNLGRWSCEELDVLIRKASGIRDIGNRIAFLSGQFLGIAYEESTLVGAVETPEAFVINLKGVDCFTFIDYIEAMRLSGSFSEFRDTLKKVRYRSGRVAVENRNHFFTDWKAHNAASVFDVTEALGEDRAIAVRKRLNQKEDGTFFVPGIAPQDRKIQYIPSEAVDSALMDRLMTGDYAGIYSGLPGLDVSHVGIIIKEKETIFFRHASSKHRKVVDEDFRDYISGKPGIVVLRPKG